MVRMVNAWTGTEMFVADDRVDEYLAAGCSLAAEAATKAETVTDEPKKAEPKPKKAPAKKTTTKK